VLELGCGCLALPSLVASRSASAVVASDGDPQALELLRDNLGLNRDTREPPIMGPKAPHTNEGSSGTVMEGGGVPQKRAFSVERILPCLLPWSLRAQGSEPQSPGSQGLSAGIVPSTESLSAGIVPSTESLSAGMVPGMGLVGLGPQAWGQAAFETGIRAKGAVVQGPGGQREERKRREQAGE